MARKTLPARGIVVFDRLRGDRRGVGHAHHVDEFRIRLGEGNLQRPVIGAGNPLDLLGVIGLSCGCRPLEKCVDPLDLALYEPPTGRLNNRVGEPLDGIDDIPRRDAPPLTSLKARVVLKIEVVLEAEGILHAGDLLLNPFFRHLFKEDAFFGIALGKGRLNPIGTWKVGVLIEGVVDLIEYLCGDCVRHLGGVEGPRVLPERRIPDHLTLLEAIGVVVARGKEGHNDERGEALPARTEPSPVCEQAVRQGEFVDRVFRNEPYLRKGNMIEKRRMGEEQRALNPAEVGDTVSADCCSRIYDSLFQNTSPPRPSR